MLLGDIQAHMMKEAAKPSGRRQDVIHPSEMAKTGWCPRATYGRIRACREASDPFLKPAESYGVQLLNIFDEGHYIHDKWQKRLRDMGDLWGNWSCTACGLFLESQVKLGNCPSYRCSQTNPNKTLEYREVPLKDSGLNIYGHADGAVPRIKALIEIKSVGTGTARIEAPDIFKANSDGQKIDLQGLWRDIKEPFPAHIRQGQIYLGLCALMGLDYYSIVFLYESKFNQGAKEFQVKYDPAVSEALFDQARQICNALDGLTEPPTCPYDGCKECEVYGIKSSTIGLVSTPIPSELTRAESPGTSIRRSSGSSKRFIRPS